MDGQPRFALSRTSAVALGMLLLAVGAAGAFVALRWSPTDRSATVVPASTPAASGDAAVVTLTPESVQRAGIVVEPVKEGRSTTILRVPAVIEANAYKRVDVTPLVSGRITAVPAALGDHVRTGQVLATMYSSELADAETQYVALMAELEAAHRQLLRVDHLVQGGVASQRELERARAEHAAHAAHVETARTRLQLLGVTGSEVAQLQSASQITAMASVVAPIDGVITARQANVGLNADTAAKLFTVADLSTVWVVGSLYEQDVSRVRTGMPATVVLPADVSDPLTSRISYIDPQLNAETRAAQIRVELPNGANRFRLGMYVDLQIETGRRSAMPMVPKTAVQIIGDRTVVYVADPASPGRFFERTVRLGASVGQDVEVQAGLQVGDAVVTAGSFALRAERDRLGPGSGRTP